MCLPNKFNPTVEFSSCELNFVSFLPKLCDLINVGGGGAGLLVGKGGVTEPSEFWSATSFHILGAVDYFEVSDVIFTTCSNYVDYG